MKKCTHEKEILDVVPQSEGCAACAEKGEPWNELRMCLTCGHVGCCDSSRNRHATRHYEETGHPLVCSLEEGEDWNWCYADETNVPTQSDRKSASVVRNYLSIAGLYTLSASLIWGVNTLFLLDAGLDIFEVFIANSVFTGSMALFEIPTGVLADTRGRRASFLLSVAVVLVGTLAYVGVAATGGDLTLFCFASVVLGLGYTFYSGAVEAWLVDALGEAGFKGQMDQIFARGSMVSGAAMLTGSILGGFLANLDLSLPFFARAGLLAVVFIVAYFTMFDRGFAPQKLALSALPAEMKRIARDSVLYGWKEPSVRLLIVAGLVNSLFMAWGFFAWAPYFLELLGEDAPWVAGVVAALISLATMGGNTLVDRVTRYCGKRTTLLLWAALVHSVAIVAVGFAPDFWTAVALYLVAMATMGVTGPVRQAYLHRLIPSEQRATVVSFDSLVSSGASMAGQTGLGRLSQAATLSSGYVAGGLVTLLVLPTLALLRRRSDEADRIVGEAGKRSACAAQGLPEATALDTVSRT